MGSHRSKKTKKYYVPYKIPYQEPVDELPDLLKKELVLSYVQNEQAEDRRPDDTCVWEDYNLERLCDILARSMRLEILPFEYPVSLI